MSTLVADDQINRLMAFSRKRDLFLEASVRRGSLRDDYQDDETKADPKHGRKVIRKLRDDLGIGDRIPGKLPGYADMFEDVLMDDPGGVILCKEDLDSLRRINRFAEQETAERLAARDLLMENSLTDSILRKLSLVLETA